MSNFSTLAPIHAKIPDLDATNWFTFKTRFRVFFLSAGLPGIVEGEKPKDAAELKKWDELDVKMLGYVYSKVSEDFLFLVDDATSASTAWAALKVKFEKTSLAARIAAREALYSIAHDPSRPIEFYLKEISTARSTLSALGVTIDDEEIIDLTLMRLDSSFHHIRTSIILASESDTTSGAKKLTLDHVKSVLGSSTGISSDSVPHIKQEDTGPTSLASAARAGGRSRGGGFSGRGSASGGSGMVDGKGYRWCDASKEGCCHRCGRQGHQAYRCIYDMPSHIKDHILGNRSPSPHHSVAQVSAAAFISTSAHSHHDSSTTAVHHASRATITGGLDSGSEDSDDGYYYAEVDDDVDPYAGGLPPLHT